MRRSLPAGYGLPSPEPSTAIVRPADRAPSWAAVSIPGASPDTTVTPRPASSAPSFLATSRP